jgi:hypothetical protein
VDGLHLLTLFFIYLPSLAVANVLDPYISSLVLFFKLISYLLALTSIVRYPFLKLVLIVAIIAGSFLSFFL